MKTFIISLIIAILSGMGLGGGGLLVIYLTLVESTPHLIAQGANLSFFIISAAASTIFSFKKHLILWKTTLWMSACGIVGAIVGTLLAGTISPDLLRKIFGSMLVISGVVSIFFQKKADK